MKTEPHRSEIETNPHSSRVEDAILCKRILEVDPAIRVAAIVDGAVVSGFASSAKAVNVLGQNGDFREKIGYWVRIVTEIARQTEPVVGRLESISFNLEKLKLVTLPLSTTRSLGLSLEKSADTEPLLKKIISRLDFILAKGP